MSTSQTLDVRELSGHEIDLVAGGASEMGDFLEAMLIGASAGGFAGAFAGPQGAAIGALAGAAAGAVLYMW